MKAIVQYSFIKGTWQYVVVEQTRREFHWFAGGLDILEKSKECIETEAPFILATSNCIDRMERLLSEATH